MAPAFNRLPPSRQSTGLDAGGGLADHRDQLGQHVFDVANDRDVNLDALGDAGRVDIDVDDLAVVLRKVLGVANHAVVKTCADSQQHIAVLHGVVGFDGAVHSRHTEVFAVTGREGTQAHQRIGDGVAEHVDQRAQLFGGIAQQHTAAGVDERALGGQQQLQGLADLSAVAFAHRVVRAHFDGLGVTGVGRLLEGNVFRDIYHHRAGTASAGNVKSFFQRHRQVARIFDEEVVLDDGARDADGVALLECIQTDSRCGHLAGDDHHRDAVHVGGGNAGDGVGHAGAGSDQGHADVAGGARIAVSGVHCSLLMAHQYVLHGVLLVQGIVNIENRATRIAPDVLHAFSLQGFDENFSSHELLGFGGVLCCGRCRC